MILQVDDIDVQRVEEARRRILEAPPYVDEPSLFERVVTWFTDRFLPNLDVGGSEWFERLFRLVDTLMPWFLGIALVVVAWWAWRRLGLRTAWTRGSRDGRSPLVDHLAADRSAGEWLREARDLAAAGEHRGAVRAAYRAVVVQMVGVEAVPATPGLTVGAHRSLVTHGEVLDLLQERGFDAASDVFERVWYGQGQPADADDVAVVVAAAQRMGVSA